MLKTLVASATIEIAVLKILMNSGFMGLMNIVMNLAKGVVIVVGIAIMFSVLFGLIGKMKETVESTEINTVSSLLYFSQI